MAFWKIDGFEVMPRTPRSTHRWISPVVDPSPLEVVEPRALALLGVEVLQSSHLSFLPAVESAPCARSASSDRAADADVVADDPELVDHLGPGAEAPKRSIDTTSSAHRCQPNVTRASTATRRHVAGKHRRPDTRRPVASNSSQHGIDTTRTVRRRAAEQRRGVDRDGDLGPRRRRAPRPGRRRRPAR